MATTATTTLSSAVAITDRSIVVASATSFVAGAYLRVDDEIMEVTKGYSSGTTIPVVRGRNGTATTAHPKTANVFMGTDGSQIASPGPQANTTYPEAGRVRIVSSYSAAGAITLPVAGCDAVAIINGTTALAMTIADPTKDLDGSVLTIVGNGAQTGGTWTFASGLNGGGGSYDQFTPNSTAPCMLQVMACNGLWMIPCCPAMTGTVTVLVGGIA